MRYFIYARKSTESDDRQVLSIDSQKVEAQRAFANRAGVSILRTFEESKSAKAPGRPVFEDMVARIERGEADGIISWHPDRLARNSVDGGRLIYLLDTGKLKDLKFANFTFENNPQGKLMLSVLLGFSKYYVDSLSENVKRGLRAKAELGWRPGNVPLGYRNDRDTRTIKIDQPHFDIVKKLLLLMETGAYSVRALLQIATVEWGYRLPEGKPHHGRLLAMSTMYKTMTNPFYTGSFLWKGRLYPGAHEAMISMETHQRILRVLKRDMKAKPQTRSFPFTGLLRCGACDLMVTAEEKTNKYGSHYTYYHCTKRGNGERCRQPSIDATELFRQLTSLVDRTTIPHIAHVELVERLRHMPKPGADTREKEILATHSLIDALTRESRGLVTMRAKDQIDDEDFLARRRSIDASLLGARERERKASEERDPFELGLLLISFRSRAVDWFVHGSDDIKRLILKTIGSHFRLQDKKVSVEARDPFSTRVEEPRFLYWCGIGENVRTQFELSEQLEKEEIVLSIHQIISMAAEEGLAAPPLPSAACAPESNTSEVPLAA